MTMGQDPAPAERDPRRSLAAAAPVVWLCAGILLSLRGLWLGWRSSLDHGFPEGVAAYVQAGMAAGIAVILLGLYVLGLAWGRDARFAAWYVAWAVLLIAVEAGMQVATLAIPAIVQTPAPWLIATATVAVTAWTIRLVRRGTAAPLPAGATLPAPAGVVALNALLGLVLGGGAGLAIGLAAGSVIIDWLDVSCFEGACGYAVVAIGLLGLLAGAIAGSVFAALRTRRSARRA